MDQLKQEKFVIIAHRGASGYMLENSYSAFQKAVELKATMIETDLRATKDGSIILMHDSALNRTALGEGKIINLDISELRSIKLKNNEDIPILDEVLKKFGHTIGFNLEIKSFNIEKIVYKTIEKHQLIDTTLISCFNFTTLQRFHKIDPKVHLALLIFFPWSFMRIKYSFDKLIENGIEAINPFHKFISKKLVDNAHNHNLKVYPWTVNNKMLALKYKEQYKVDGIITNYPDILEKD